MSALDSSSDRASRPPSERVVNLPVAGPDCSSFSCFVEATPPGLGTIPGWLGRRQLQPSPLPKFSWADSDELWEFLLTKDQTYKIDPGYLAKQHSLLTPRMRAILLDWLIEVSEVYKLHRETFYLAVYYCDRYLAHQHDVAKEKLQLIGVTSLFVASKMEEIYPPKLTDFAYVTDGACTEGQILNMEIILMEGLEWLLLPVTPNVWLGIFLQLANVSLMKEPSENFIHPQYSGKDFVKIMQVSDKVLSCSV
jgi:cyclin E